MKKSSLQAVLVTIGSLFILSSCYYGGSTYDPYYVPDSRQKENVYYVTSPAHTPLLTEKGDINFNFLGNIGALGAGLDIQAAFMPNKNIGVMGAYSNTSTSGYQDYFSYQRFELGAGYVKKFSDYSHAEIYSGLGTGKIVNKHYTGKSHLKLTHFFLQPAIVFESQNKNIQFAFLSKFSGVNFKVMDTLFITDREKISSTQVKKLYEKKFHMMLEPGAIFRFGWENILFYASYSLSADLTKPQLHREKYNVSLGLSLRINSLASEKIQNK